jgi:hypothetical protein
MYTHLRIISSIRITNNLESILVLVFLLVLVLFASLRRRTHHHLAIREGIILTNNNDSYASRVMRSRSPISTLLVTAITMSDQFLHHGRLLLARLQKVRSGQVRSVLVPPFFLLWLMCIIY